MTGNRRRHGRRAFTSAAYLDCGTPQGLVRCVFQDVSAEGARLVVPDARLIPDMLDLKTSPHVEAGRACRVAWRGHTTIGITFLERDDVPTGLQ